MSIRLLIEEKLPSSVLAKASLRGNEYAWSLPNVEEAIAAAEAVGLVNLGGQPQFRYPAGICELYWLNADASEQHEDEDWPDYVTRSANEVRISFRQLFANTDFEAEARSFSFLAEKLDRGEDIMPHLCFVLYFADGSA